MSNPSQSESVPNLTVPSLAARANWRRIKGELRLFLEITLRQRTAPDRVTLTLPEVWRPDGGLYLGADPDTPELRDNGGRQWLWEPATATDLTVELRHTVSPGNPTDDWTLSLVCLIGRPEGEGSRALPLRLALDEGPALSTNVSVHPPTADEAYTIELNADARDLSAVRVGSTFSLSWVVEGAMDGAPIEHAMLYGPISDTRSSARVFPAPELQGPIQVCVMGEMTFKLRVKIAGRDEEVVRELRAGVLTDHRGGRVNVWPRQVLPRGPVAVIWSAYRVQEMLFHGITGANSEGFVDTPEIPNVGHLFERSTGAGSVEETNFTLSFGPQAGAIWQIEAETTPAGDSRQLEARVTAVGERTLASSLRDYTPDENNAWSYLAFRSVKQEEYIEEVVQADSPPTLNQLRERRGSDDRARAMVAGRFQIGKVNRQLRWREWIVVAFSSRVELHLNKEKDGRSYRVDFNALAQGPLKGTTCPLREDLERSGLLGLGAAEDIDTVDGKPARNGDCLLTARRAPRVDLNGNELPDAEDQLLIREHRLPLDATALIRHAVVKLEGKRVEDTWPGLPVRLVALWPRVYVFTSGQAWSYDRAPAPTAAPILAVREPQLDQVAGAEWRVLALPRPGTSRVDEHGAPLSPGWLYAMRSDGSMLRFDVPPEGTLSTGPLRASNANGRVLPLHELLRSQGDVNHAPHTTDGRVLLGKSGNKYKRVQNAIGADSSFYRIGGVLVARSEVHDPLIPLAQTRADEQARGLQDRAYNPRLNRWIRAGHPFPGAGDRGERALFAATETTLYCWHQNGKIVYIAPIEPSHLGFLPVDTLPTAKLDQLHYLRGGERMSAREGLTNVQEGLCVVLQGNTLKLKRIGNDETLSAVVTAQGDELVSVEVTPEGVLLLRDASRVVWRSSEHGGAPPRPPSPRMKLRLEGGELTLGVSGQPFRWRAPRDRAQPMVAGSQCLARGETLWSPARLWRLELTLDGTLRLVNNAGRVAWRHGPHPNAALLDLDARTGELKLMGWGGETLFSSVRDGGGVRSPDLANSVLYLTDHGVVSVGQPTTNTESWRLRFATVSLPYGALSQLGGPQTATGIREIRAWVNRDTGFIHTFQAVSRGLGHWPDPAEPAEIRSRQFDRKVFEIPRDQDLTAARLDHKGLWVQRSDGTSASFGREPPERGNTTLRGRLIDLTIGGPVRLQGHCELDFHYELQALYTSGEPLPKDVRWCADHLHDTNLQLRRIRFATYKGDGRVENVELTYADKDRSTVVTVMSAPISAASRFINVDLASDELIVELRLGISAHGDIGTVGVTTNKGARPDQHDPAWAPEGKVTSVVAKGELLGLNSAGHKLQLTAIVKRSL